MRVSIGAALSMLDAATDTYVISKYYNTEGLRGQANAMLVMIATNMGFQILFVVTQYSKKSWKVKIKEVLFCLFFLRPAVDAFRVSTNHKDNETTSDPLTEMITNKVRVCRELYPVLTSNRLVLTTPSSLQFILRFVFVLIYSLPSLLASRFLVAYCKFTF